MTTDSVADCLPPEMRGPDTAIAITKLAKGMSGAGVYRVDAGGQAYVLKVAADSESAADWRGALTIQRLAAGAEIAPRIVHVDEQRRAVLTALVADRSFGRFYGDPRSHLAAVVMLGQTVRRIHALAIPADAPRRDPRAFLAQIAGAAPPAGFALPAFVLQAIEKMLAESPPAVERPPVLSHNDLNPSNLIYDGQSIQILDWAAAGISDPHYDLAVLAVFLGMNQDTCLRLLSAYDATRVTAIPAGFTYLRRLAGTLAGTAGLHNARLLGHPGSDADTLDSALPLGAFYQQMMTGRLKLGTPEGNWAFGLSLIKGSLAVEAQR